MITIMTLPFAGIVGLVAFLQANDGGRKYFFASLGLLAVSWGYASFGDPELLRNGQVAALLGGATTMGVFLIAGTLFGQIGKHHWSASKTGWIAGLATMALLWGWAWIGILK